MSSAVFTSHMPDHTAFRVVRALALHGVLSEEGAPESQTVGGDCDPAARIARNSALSIIHVWGAGWDRLSEWTRRGIVTAHALRLAGKSTIDTLTLESQIRFVVDAAFLPIDLELTDLV